MRSRSEGRQGVVHAARAVERTTLKVNIMIPTLEEFWQMADDTRLAAEYNAGDELAWVSTASQAQLQKIFLEYRVFTASYADDLALLVARTPRGQLKTLMSALVYEELGSGEPDKSHIEMLERFVQSLGVRSFDSDTDPRNLQLLREMRSMLLEEPPIYGIALRGMGGECVCQVYLTELHRQLVKNPYCRECRASLDWEFWDVHAGEPDLEHNRMVKRGINEFVADHPDSLPVLVNGYHQSKKMLLEFFGNIYDTARRSA
jgi:hypothetical protein